MSEAKRTRRDVGEKAARSIVSEWKGSNVLVACDAARRLGQITGRLLPYDRTANILRLSFAHNKVDQSHWSAVNSSFAEGRFGDATLADVWQRYAPIAANDNQAEDDSIDAESLLGMEFSPLEYVIPGYVVEGLTVLGGKPKLGKSWWAYDASIAVASGGKAMGAVDCEQGDVLYLALEDNRRRVKDRILTLCPTRKLLGINLDRLTIRTVAPRIDTGLFAELDKWRAECVRPRLVVVDVYMKVRPPRKKGEDAYAADYAAVVPLQRYASEHRLAVVLVTHTRKMEAEDPLEAISGTNGVTGAADAVLVLNRDSKGTTLYGRGRDIEEIETAMRFDAGRWSILGNADDVRKSDERRKIVAALKEAGDEQTPAAIAKLTGMKAENVRVLLRKMVKDGEVLQPRVGFYTVPAQFGKAA
ncbi:AAA family ATPase [Bradyrhizobium sp. DASA03076]|uniref:AAA family ATPase n=1 Tax=Bradyrhizobium sp. BLXBL-03 TaxID=3395916 RepID=UPI003F6EDA64